MLLAWMVAGASAQNFQPPNSVLGVGIGTPSLLSLRGEAWFAEQASFELGVGVPSDFDLQALGTDWALRWRPDFACLNCGEQVLATFGVGAGGLVGPNFDGGPWSFAAGLDLVGTGVYWFTPTLGVHLSGRFGVGPGWVGSDFDAIETGVWAFVSAGLAF